MKKNNETQDIFIFGDELGIIEKKNFDELSLISNINIDDQDDEYSEYYAYAVTPT